MAFISGLVIKISTSIRFRENRNNIHVTLTAVLKRDSIELSE